ncbi:MAG TPA: hypothetical protein VN756_02450 [Solirubrobacterales bacterium]|nr:hypothetical protein [Solirubrobacterales bacterium]
MHLMRESWTDARLDDLAAHVDKRFDAVDKRLDGVEADLKGMQRAMVHGTIALTSAFVAGFAAMIGLVATQI